MIAKNTDVLRLLAAGRIRFVVPLFQRDYSWTKVECSQLWDDIRSIGSANGTTNHFIGSIVYMGSGPSLATGIDSLLLIDGQQRLTTVMLLLEALSRAIGDSEPIDGFSAAKVRDVFLLNAHERGDSHYKLVLNEKDRDSFAALMDQAPLPNDSSERVVKNFKFMEQQIEKLGTDDIASLFIGLGRLDIVDVALDAEKDNPQLIFESMNSTGRRLTPADMIRNFVLMGLNPDQQEALWRNHWRPMEAGFGQGTAYAQSFNQFMRHYLTLKTGDIPNVSAVYEAFKRYSEDIKRKGGSVETLVADVRRFAGHYCVMSGLSEEPEPRLAEAFQDLKEFRVDVAYPFLLALYDDYSQGNLGVEDFLGILRLIEAHVFRRAVCSVPTNSLNKTFVNLGRSVDKDRYFVSVCEEFMKMPSYRRFPRDDEFRRALIDRDLYNFPRRQYWLRRLENHGRKERVLLEEYTVEHIMPQNENLSAEWQAALGDDWRDIHNKYLHTLGNLTLTAYNPEYSDRSFPEKRDMSGGFAHSPLNLNEGLGSVSEWNEEAIKRRAGSLADLALAVWASPPAEFSPKVVASGGVTDNVALIDNFQYLERGGISRILLDALRTQLFGLDPCVTEHVWVHYIAYRAETNFVDVVPRASSLRLILNMPYADLDDPRGLAENIAGVGHLGNGDVLIRLTNLEELPYAMAMARQAIQRQMADWDFIDSETETFADDIEAAD